ncbi:hypothetical protein HanRHA438_Chr14g0630981 [Helianthus annuus]|nr:hypothetical protein HanRHA438_Chr14g0630981 [Helianthus annuus]
MFKLFFLQRVGEYGKQETKTFSGVNVSTSMQFSGRCKRIGYWNSATVLLCLFFFFKFGHSVFVYVVIVFGVWSSNPLALGDVLYCKL